MSPLQPGSAATLEFSAEDPLLTDVGGALDYSVLSTPGMIEMMEWAATKLVGPHLSERQATVGFEVCVKHVRGAPAGAACTARAQLREADGRKLYFDVEVVAVDGTTIGVGTHQRRIIDTSR